MESSNDSSDNQLLMVNINDFKIVGAFEMNLVKHANEGGEGSRKYNESVKDTANKLGQLFKTIQRNGPDSFVALENPGYADLHICQGGDGVSCILGQAEPDGDDDSKAAMSDPDVMKFVSDHFAEKNVPVPKKQTTMTINYVVGEQFWYQKAIVWGYDHKVDKLIAAAILTSLASKLIAYVVEKFAEKIIVAEIEREIEVGLARGGAFEIAFEGGARKTFYWAVRWMSTSTSRWASGLKFLGNSAIFIVAMILVQAVIDGFIVVDYYQNFEVYNYTDQDLEFKVPYQDNVATHVGTIINPVIKAAMTEGSIIVPGFGPRKLKPEERVVYFATFDAQNSNPIFDGLSSLVTLNNVTESSKKNADLNNVVAEATIHRFADNKTAVKINETSSLDEGKTLFDKYDKLETNSQPNNETNAKYQVTIGYDFLNDAKNNKYNCVMNVVDTKLFPEMSK